MFQQRRLDPQAKQPRVPVNKPLNKANNHRRIHGSTKPTILKGRPFLDRRIVASESPPPDKPAPTLGTQSVVLTHVP